MEIVEIETNSKHACTGHVLSCDETGRTIASFWHDSDIEDAANKINSHDRLVQERDNYKGQLVDLFEDVSGCDIIEFNDDQIPFLSDFIQGQSEADALCIDKLKKERDELSANLDLMLLFANSVQLNVEKEVELEALISKIQGGGNA